MKRFHLTIQAAGSLVEILRTVERVKPGAAGAVGGQFLGLFDLLGRFPAMGCRRKAITQHPIRMISLYGCLVLYRPETVLVEILAIVPLAEESARLLSDNFNDEVDETELVLQSPDSSEPHSLKEVSPAQLEGRAI